jgi:hypothetical protein
MLSVADLWLPVVVSAVAVWFAAALAWMALPHHKGDYKQLPNEDEVMNTVRGWSLSPGMYFFPHMKDCKDMKANPEAKAKFENGPHGLLQVWPPTFMQSMGRNMLLSFIFYIVVGVFVAYLGSLSMPRGTEFMKVFQVTGTAGVMAYCFANIPQDIWFGKPLRNVLACVGDGIVFGLMTGAIFGWMWPSAV